MMSSGSARWKAGKWRTTPPQPARTSRLSGACRRRKSCACRNGVTGSATLLHLAGPVHHLVFPQIDIVHGGIGLQQLGQPGLQDVAGRARLRIDPLDAMCLAVKVVALVASHLRRAGAADLLGHAVRFEAHARADAQLLGIGEGLAPDLAGPSPPLPRVHVPAGSSRRRRSRRRNTGLRSCRSVTCAEADSPSDRRRSCPGGRYGRRRHTRRRETTRPTGLPGRRRGCPGC